MTGTPSAVRARLRTAAVRLIPPVRRLEAERLALRRTQTDLHRRLRRADQRLDALRKQNSDLRAAAVKRQIAGSTDESAGLGYLFVIGYGRSGSTLLQGILCSIPGYLVRGENKEALYRLFKYHQLLVDAKAANSPGYSLSPRHSFYGIEKYADEAALIGMRALVLQTLLRPEADTRVIGFKEIRWWQKDWKDYLIFLQQLFPGARFVINVRDHDAVVASRWWATRPDARTKLAQYETQLTEMEAVLGDSVYRVSFDEYVADPGTLAGLYDWLGEPFDRETVERVMQVKHSF